MIESRPQIYAGLSEHLQAGTRAHWIEVLLAHDVWCAPVQNYEELVADPQVAHNGASGMSPSAEARRPSSRPHRRSRSRPPRPGSATASHARASTRTRCSTAPPRGKLESRTAGSTPPRRSRTRLRAQASCPSSSCRGPTSPCRSPDALARGRPFVRRDHLPHPGRARGPRRDPARRIPRSSSGRAPCST